MIGSSEWTPDAGRCFGHPDASITRLLPMDGLKHLLNAPSKKAVQDLFVFAFERRRSALTAAELEQAAKLVAIEPSAAAEVFPSTFDPELLYNYPFNYGFDAFRESFDTFQRTFFTSLVVSVPLLALWRSLRPGNLVQM